MTWRAPSISPCPSVSSILPWSDLSHPVPAVCPLCETLLLAPPDDARPPVVDVRSPVTDVRNPDNLSVAVGASSFDDLPPPLVDDKIPSKCDAPGVYWRKLELRADVESSQSYMTFKAMPRQKLCWPKMCHLDILELKILLAKSRSRGKRPWLRFKCHIISRVDIRHLQQGTQPGFTCTALPAGRTISAVSSA